MGTIKRVAHPSLRNATTSRQQGKRNFSRRGHTDKLIPAKLIVCKPYWVHTNCYLEESQRESELQIHG